MQACRRGVVSLSCRFALLAVWHSCLGVVETFVLFELALCELLLTLLEPLLLVPCLLGALRRERPVEVACTELFAVGKVCESTVAGRDQALGVQKAATRCAPSFTRLCTWESSSPQCAPLDA
jgi:hypothetical protein